MGIKVIEVNMNNINKFNKDINKVGNVAIVIYHASWCGYCKEFFNNEWGNIKNMVKGIKGNMILATVEEKFNNNINVDNNIGGFPTIRLYKSGNKIEDMPANSNVRKANNFINYIKSVIPKAIKRKRNLKRKRKSNGNKSKVNKRKSKRNKRNKRKSKRIKR